MGKQKSRNAVPDESHFLLPVHPTNTSTTTSIIDTHTHLESTFSTYRSKYQTGKYESLYDFVKGMYKGKNVEGIVDVWCEPAVLGLWKEIADSAVSEADRKEKWGGLEYWFVIGIHPHHAKEYTDEIESQILEAMNHPRCVGWGEMGLDYHYDNSPREIQREVFARQLRHAVRLGKPLTIHTREADEDTIRILKEEVPKDHKIHIHCFTDVPETGETLLAHFPNLCIGITGVVTFSTNLNTAEIIRRMAPSSPTSGEKLRILLETDAPYMVPSNIYNSISGMKGRFPLSHSAMIPWTADFVANLLGEGWDSERVIQESRNNAKLVYGV